MHVQMPYSQVLGKYFHLKQISLAMHGEPLYLAPRRITDISFEPGIPHGTKTSTYAKGSIGPAQEQARKRLHDVAKTDWRQSWYGVSYEDAAAAYDEIEEDSRDERLWSILDIPSVDELEMIATFYEHWQEVTAQDRYLATEIRTILPVPPALDVLAPAESDEEEHSNTRKEEQAMEGDTPLEIEAECDDQGNDTSNIVDLVGKGKQKDTTSQDTAMPSGGSDIEMEVDGGHAHKRERYLLREKGKGSRSELYETPTREQDMYLKVRLSKL